MTSHGTSVKKVAEEHERKDPHLGHLLALSLGSLGVVFGDIGTSPLYALRVCFGKSYSLFPTHANVLGALSLILWALVITISIKYLVFVLRADNRGEGGILALMSLVRSEDILRGRKGLLLIALGVFGAALLYGDGVITPAITVLSAIEGLEVATPAFIPYVMWITVALLVALFAFQRKGTAGVGAVFGPVMVLWFLVMAVLGIRGIFLNPSVLAAVNPWHAVDFFLRNKVHGFLALGAIFLVQTGGEALYADMGHFGRKPIRLAWFGLVFPALLLNYFGQGALILMDPATVEEPFFHLAPKWAVIPLVILATAAGIIASQAVISGSFSLTRQAVQLGYSPRLSIRHTSTREIGQIYVPSVNWVLMAATVALVLGFKTSDNLAAAYGVAVTTTMVITTVLFFFLARHGWGWPLFVAAPIAITFLVPDMAFFFANVIKVEEGGWLPLVMAAVIYLLMTTWKKGRKILFERLTRGAMPVDLFVKEIQNKPPIRVPGTAVYMTGNPTGVPGAMLHNLKHYHVLHEKIVFLTTVTEEVPYVSKERHLSAENLGGGIFRLVARYGFMETPDVPSLLKSAAKVGLQFDMMSTTFFLGRETLVPSSKPQMAPWRARLFALMSRNAQSATSFFGLPVNRVVELGAQIEL